MSGSRARAFRLTALVRCAARCRMYGTATDLQVGFADNVKAKLQSSYRRSATT
jgi:hypothetical protein